MIVRENLALIHRTQEKQRYKIFKLNSLPFNVFDIAQGSERLAFDLALDAKLSETRQFLIHPE